MSSEGAAVPVFTFTKTGPGSDLSVVGHAEVSQRWRRDDATGLSEFFRYGA
jgi:hypothetical protein